MSCFDFGLFVLSLKREFPSHLGKDVGKIAKELVREGLLITKPTSYGLNIFLNKERLGEINELIYKGHLMQLPPRTIMISIQSL